MPLKTTLGSDALNKVQSGERLCTPSLSNTKYKKAMVSKLSLAPLTTNHVKAQSTNSWFPSHNIATHVDDAHATAFIHLNNMLPIGTTVKGKQRIKNRKKVLTPLKKHILKERLFQWQKSQGILDNKAHGNEKDQDANQDSRIAPCHDKSVDSNPCSGDDYKLYSSIVFLKDYALLEEVQDDDEYQEIFDNLTELSKRIGPVSSVYIPRCAMSDSNQDSDFMVYVRFVNVQDALAAKACWNGMVFGGNQVHVDVIPKTCLVDLKELQDGQSDTETWTKFVQGLSYEKLQGVVAAAAAAAKSGQDLSGSQERDPECACAVVCLPGILTEDDLDDDEDLEETLKDVRKLALQHGSLSEEHGGIEVDKVQRQIKLYYNHVRDARDAVEKLNESVLGGISIHAKLDSSDVPPSVEESTFIVHLDNILCDDDYEDEDCLNATKEDIQLLSKECGSPVKIDVPMDDEFKGRLSLYYSTEKSAIAAVAKFNNKVIGGETIHAWMEHSISHDESAAPILELRNILSKEDLDDEDCLEETKNDIYTMVQKYGEIHTFHVETTGKERGTISVVFSDKNIALQVSRDLDGKILGGSPIHACIKANGTCTNSSATEKVACNVQEEAKLEPLYSGDKIIPEEYAQCKRIPKIPNPGVPREYAKTVDDDSVVPLLFDMLGELMRLQLRAKENGNKKAKRRLVLGLREVARGIRAHKVKLVVMANNLDQYGALDAKLQEILTLANEHDVPVLFDLNKRKLGKALGKTIKISVVGIENADGAYEPFKKLKQICEKRL